MSDTGQNLKQPTEKDIKELSFEVEAPTDVYYGVDQLEEVKDGYVSEKDVTV